MFSKSLFAAVASCGLLATSVTAHMVIREPIPYGQSTLTNSPLENDGSDFPCKQRSGVYDITKMNDMPVGVPQNLAFTGGATHGGGSCQVSVTLDKEPTKDSEWKVIHSIVGGCPSNSSANLSGDPGDQESAVFQFSIPKGMPNGQYTLAWTWFNKIGNREMYMNCAPITVTGGADNNDVFKTLPTMFVINIPNEECATAEGEDFVFPDPGAYAETPFRTALGSATTGSGCAAVTVKGAGAGNAGGATQPTEPPTASSSAAASVSAPSSQGFQASYTAPYAIQTKAPAFNSAPVPPQGADVSSVSNIVTMTSMLTVTATGSPPAANTESPVPGILPGLTYGSAPNSPPTANGTTSPNDSNTSGSCTGGAVACSNDGGVVCIGSDQWGLCDRGCAVPMALSAGTSCSAGTVSKRRSLHLQRHLHHIAKI